MLRRSKEQRCQVGKRRDLKNLLLKGSGTRRDTRTSGGNNIENEKERGLEDENDDRDQTTRATKTTRVLVLRTTETTREPKRRLSNTAKT